MSNTCPPCPEYTPGMRIQIYLSETEFEQIAELAERERRDPPDQIVYMALKALEETGQQEKVQEYAGSR